MARHVEDEAQDARKSELRGPHHGCRTEYKEAPHLWESWTPETGTGSRSATPGATIALPRSSQVGYKSLFAETLFTAFLNTLPGPVSSPLRERYRSSPLLPGHTGIYCPLFTRHRRVDRRRSSLQTAGLRDCHPGRKPSVPHSTLALEERLLKTPCPSARVCSMGLARSRWPGGPGLGQATSFPLRPGPRPREPEPRGPQACLYRRGRLLACRSRSSSGPAVPPG